MIGVLLTTSPAVDRFDGPEIAMTLGVVVTAIASVITAIIANRGRQHSQVVRAQVENDHADAKNPNLRVDLDDKFETLEQSVDKVSRGQDRIMTKLTNVEGDVSLLKDGYQSNRQRIENLEDTDPSRQERLWGPPRTRAERRARDAR